MRADLRKNGIRTLTSNCAQITDTSSRTMAAQSAKQFSDRIRDLEGSVYIAGTRPQPSSVVAFENYYQALPNNPCR